MSKKQAKKSQVLGQYAKMLEELGWANVKRQDLKKYFEDYNQRKKDARKS